MTDRLRFFCSDMVTPMRKICIVVFFFLLWGTSGISARAIGARDFLFLRTIGQFRGLYEIRSALDADFALDVSSCSDGTDNRLLQLYRAGNVNQQKFSFSTLGRGVCQIRAAHTGSRLCAAAEGRETDGSLEQVLFMDPGISNLSGGVSALAGWVLEYAGDGAWYIRARKGEYLTCAGAYNGAQVTLNAFTGEENQQWILEKTTRSDTDYQETDLPNPYEEGGSWEDRVLFVDIGGSRETLSAKTLAGWLVKTDGHALAPDSEAVSVYAASLAEKYDTKGKPRTFLTSYGEEITLKMGNYGWALDQAALVEQILSMLLSDWETNTATVTAEWSQRGAVREETTDIGKTYVEVDLSGQKVWLYKDGQLLVSTDCVTGTRGTEYATPGGVYRLYGKESPSILVGEDYRTPVDFWMPFNGGIGLHDATWRSAFGGDIYLTNGSHGCVNLPYDAARQIYETISVGDPVVCYYYEYKEE